MGRDQFLIRSQETFGENKIHRCAVWWGDHRRGGAVLDTDFSSTLAKEAAAKNAAVTCLTKDAAVWSPMGSYLTTLHKDLGVRTWCQERSEWVSSQKLMHPGCLGFDWSPREKFLNTFAVDDNGECNVTFWISENGTKRRTFQADYHIQAGFKWPLFKWSHDDKYFAWIGCSKWNKKDPKSLQGLGKGDADKFTIFDADTCNKLKKDGNKFVASKHIRLLEFSPGMPLLAYATKGTLDTPTSISLMEIPSLRQIVTSSHFDVHHADLLWHSNGAWLC